MAYSRILSKPLSGNELDVAMRGCGMRIGRGRATARAPDIELTIASAALEALPTNYRLLGVLVAWLEQHAGRVNVPLLRRYITASDADQLTLAWWATIGRWLGLRDARWRSMGRLYQGPPVSLEDDMGLTKLHVARHGEEPRFERGPILAHAKLLRARRADVDDPIQLMRRHPTYRARVWMGANYRADVWAALDRDAERTSAELAREVGCAYETARAVAADWRLAHA